MAKYEPAHARYAPASPRLVELRQTLEALNKARDLCLNPVFKACERTAKIEAAIDRTVTAITMEVDAIIAAATTVFVVDQQSGEVSKEFREAHHGTFISNAPPPQPPPVTRGGPLPELGFFAAIADTFKWMCRNPRTGPR